MQNPLLTENELPDFEEIRLEHFQPAIEHIIFSFKEQLPTSLKSESNDFIEVVSPLSDLTARLDYVWSIFSHMKSVTDSDALRSEFDKLSSVITGFYTELGQNQPLFEAYKKVQERGGGLTSVQQSMLYQELRDFRLNGVALPAEKKARFAEIRQELVNLSNKFAENVLDATQAWTLHIEDQEELDGLPESILESLQSKAQAKGFESGYLITLDIPCYLPVMQYAKNRALREQVYTAYLTRASDQGPMSGQYDNSELMLDILKLRKELAMLLGFDTYAELSVETKMAEDPEQVLQFLIDLAEKALDLARSELDELRIFASAKLGMDQVEAWDLAYVAESFRKASFDLDQEELRPYFPLPTVLAGLFELVETLFGVRLEEQDGVQVPHPDTKVFALKQGDETIAHIYTDLYARENKRGGAWVGPCQKKSRSADGQLIKPLAFLVCNFSAPTESKPSQLTHNEMITLFHEFGHALHHCLTEVEQPEISGISGVPWDAVELPSQFLENWCWEPEVLVTLSGHVDTGAPLPQEIIDRMIAAKGFQAAMQTVRQLEFALFDFRLHHEFEEGSTQVMHILREVQDVVAVMPVPDFARFPHGFSHIFAGGYSAGYYSYKWAEVLAADAYSAFEEEGVLNAETGARFRREILAQGGSRDVNEMFMAFRGRMPTPDALLEKIGVQK
jgi:oligopeptidase A